MELKNMYRAYFKRTLDLIFSFVLLIFLLPVIAAIVLLIKIKLGSPVIFRQDRPGLNEKIFSLYKFRTMNDGKDEKGESLPDYIRLTKFGSFLRSTSLDELPQLWNILKGDMSFIGPRPLFTKYLQLYNEVQKRRHEVRPGLTGLAQVNGRNTISWEDKFKLDVEYTDSITFTGDCRILIKTIKKVMLREGINQDGEATVEDFKGTPLCEKNKMEQRVELAENMACKTDTDNMEIMDNLNTPYFMLDEKELKNGITQLGNALDKHWKNYIIGYSFKTNSLPWLLSYFRNNGFYAEVVSEDEYQLAHTVGYEGHKLVYNGPLKSKETFIDAINKGCIVNIDSMRELCWLKELDGLNDKKIDVGIRVNFDLEKYCPNESACEGEGGRFGFCFENGELNKVIDQINYMNHVCLAGIHLHCSTKTRSINIYRAISKIACEIKRTYNLNLKYVDVGGGFYGGLIDKPAFNDYLRVIAEELGREFDKENTILIVEPGTSLVSSAVSFVTSVEDVKKTIRNYFVVTDGSRIYIDPLMSKSGYFYKIQYGDGIKSQTMEEQVICGCTCMENDRLFVLENHPQLSAGDRIIYEKVGAYTMCLSPMFIQYYPAVYVKENDSVYKARDRWTVKEYVQKSRLY